MARDKGLRGEIRSVLEDAAREMGLAVDSIRNEVIEKGWFGRELTPEVQKEWLREPFETTSNHHTQGPQDFSTQRDAVYGKDAERTQEREMSREPDRER